MIETKGLRKSFQVGKGRKATKVEAVCGVDLKVGGGEIFGFLGPNGAGKTTTLRMLTTLLEPDGGDAVAGAEFADRAQDMRLGRHIQSRRRLICDQEIGVTREVVKARTGGKEEAAVKRDVSR